MDSRNWYYEKTNKGTYIAFDGSEEDLDEFVATLLRSNIGVKTSLRSFRPASNGRQYEWYVTINEDHVEQDVVDALNDPPEISGDSPALSILKKLESLGVQVIAYGDGIDFDDKTVGFQPHQILELKRYAKNKTKDILDILRYRGAAETPRKGLKWEEEEHGRAQLWLEQGRSVEEIAALLGRTPAAIEYRFNLPGTEVDENEQPVDSGGSPETLDEIKKVIENSGQYSGKQLQEIQKALERINDDNKRDRQSDVERQNQLLGTINQTVEDINKTKKQLSDLKINIIDLEKKVDSSSDRENKELKKEIALKTQKFEETTKAYTQLLEEAEKELEEAKEEIANLSKRVKELETHDSNPETQQNAFTLDSSSDRKLTEAVTQVLDVMTPNVNYLGSSIDRLAGTRKVGFLKPGPTLKLIKKLSDDGQLPSTKISAIGRGWKEYRRGKKMRNGASIQTGEKSRDGRLFYRNNDGRIDVIVDFKFREDICHQLMLNLPK